MADSLFAGEPLSGWFGDWCGSRRMDILDYSVLMVTVPTQRPWGEGHTFFSLGDGQHNFVFELPLSVVFCSFLGVAFPVCLSLAATCYRGGIHHRGLALLRRNGVTLSIVSSC